MATYSPRAAVWPCLLLAVSEKAFVDIVRRYPRLSPSANVQASQSAWLLETTSTLPAPSHPSVASFLPAKTSCVWRGRSSTSRSGTTRERWGQRARRGKEPWEPLEREHGKCIVIFWVVVTPVHSDSFRLSVWYFVGFKSNRSKTLAMISAASPLPLGGTRATGQSLAQTSRSCSFLTNRQTHSG